MLMTKFVTYFLKNCALEKLKTFPNIDISVLLKPISTINKTYIYFPFPSKIATIFT
jgi:type IV secretory pathway VirB6-like protein